MPAPQLLPIKRMEDLHTAWIGRCKEGQFMIVETLPVVVPADSEPTPREEWIYIVQYLFRPTGEFKEAKHAKAAYSAGGEYQQVVTEKTREFLVGLGSITLCDIAVRPFQTHIDGIKFGLIYDEETESVDLEPDALITFMEPWDGEYYT